MAKSKEVKSCNCKNNEAAKSQNKKQANTEKQQENNECDCGDNEIAKLQEQIQELEIEKLQNLDLAKRVQAEFDNFRKRTNGVRMEAENDGIIKAVTPMLSIVDTIEIAITSYKNSESIDENVLQGYELILKQFLNELAKIGVKPMQCEDVPFDPNFHNAILQEECEDKESGNILEVLQKGYLLNDQVVRYAMVKVVK